LNAFEADELKTAINALGRLRGADANQLNVPERLVNPLVWRNATNGAPRPSTLDHELKLTRQNGHLSF
jgi:hypothetical protein